MGKFYIIFNRSIFDLFCSVWSSAGFKEAGKFLDAKQVNPPTSEGLEESMLEMEKWTFDKEASYFYFC